MTSRLESYIKELNKNNQFCKDACDDFVEKLYFNGLWGEYDTYKYFIEDVTRFVRMIDYTLGREIPDDLKSYIEENRDNEEIMFGCKYYNGYDYNKVAIHYIGDVYIAFASSFAQTIYSRNIDEELAIHIIKDYDNRILGSQGAVFMGEDCDKLLENFVDKLGVKRCYQVEFDGKTDPSVLTELYNDLKQDIGFELVVIIKNIHFLDDDLKLRSSFLVFLNEISEIANVILLCTSENLYARSYLNEVGYIRIRVTNDSYKFKFFD